MPSNSAIKFHDRIGDLRHLRSLAIDSRIQPIQEKQKQVYLHSYLTGIVAAWDTYVKAITKEYLALISLPTDVRYMAVYNLLVGYTSTSIEKLNTPNADNVRNFLISTTGYDPISDWIWKARSLNGHQTRERLNEILKVRHSFAHGFSMPSYTWNQSKAGKTRLTTKAVDDATTLLSFLVQACDKGLKITLSTTHGIRVTW
ncbi:HEPN domain-containing protein [Chitinophaga sp. 212800010-3]|uniref:HEPN domain-containing protein n=1 Tax=unclassified Chitinophaga TaxID=2619133 RepID=UPI002DE87A8F|nr:hypothetical protein [Chitinophaga sp. 212800010-3]